MKTTISISIFASLFIMINSGEKPQLLNQENTIMVAQQNYASMPDQKLMANNEKKTTSFIGGSTLKAATTTKDFSYLKFDVSDYADFDTKTPEAMPEASNFNYLKFDVSSYPAYLESDYENLGMPVNEFENLKFKVGNFNQDDSSTIMELPVDEFGYLKFNIQSHANNDSSALGELPETEN